MQEKRLIKILLNQGVVSHMTGGSTVRSTTGRNVHICSFIDTFPTFMSVSFQEKLMSVLWSCDPPRLPYTQYFGGVSAVTPEQYMKMNGFPNHYWGWGGEDDDIAAR